MKDNSQIYKAAVTAPHYLATQAGETILSQGGNAIEACVAMASTLCVAYPHMTNLGGDGFWLICEPGKEPKALNAAGKTAANVDLTEFGKSTRGPKVALTTAGAVSGWEQALSKYPGDLSLAKILQPAIDCATNGIEVTVSLNAAMNKLIQEYPNADFANVFLKDSLAYSVGDKLKLPALAQTLTTLATQGLGCWTKGELAIENADYLAQQGSPITLIDLQTTKAKWTQALSLETQWGKFYNLGAPTQGGSSLQILGILDQYLKMYSNKDDFWLSSQGEEELLHVLIEATKVAFQWRNEQLCDDPRCDELLMAHLDALKLAKQAQQVSDKAAHWPKPGATGDTVWMGVVDSKGVSVSYIQSIYWEFGSGLVNPKTGVVWNNRCLGFNSNPNHPNAIRPGKQPMHTLNPAMAVLKDASTLVYGTMGGEGQPQTQAAIMWRFLVQKQNLQDALNAPRWLLGKTWGRTEDNLKLEQELFDKHGISLIKREHDAVAATKYAEFFGHAGAIQFSPGSSCAASDPRSDGRAIVFE